MNYQKGFIAPLLLALIALLLIGGGAYVYVQNKPANQPVTASSTTQTTSAAQSQDDSDKILLGDRALYKNLTPDEKAIVEDFYNNGYKDVPARYAAGAEATSCRLKYYDPAKALIGCVSVKPSLPFYLVDRKDWKDVGENSGQLNSLHGYVESVGYAITVDGTAGIYYYKAGNSGINIVSNSRLAKCKNTNGADTECPNGETYVRQSGMSNDYEASFDESTKTLTVSIFKNIGNEESENPEIRTATFILP